RVALAFVVEQARRPVELLFNQARDGFVDDFRGCARIGRVDRDAGRRNLGKLRNGQVRDREQPRQDNEQGDNPGKDWAADKKLRHEDDLFGYSWRCLSSSVEGTRDSAPYRAVVRPAPGEGA